MANDERNLLGEEKSPYLLQHKDNPVWWRPWGGAAFEEARRKDLPIFLSIGYATCHWCHVMEGDSFEKQDVAELLNRHFVSVKVDREERPDVDALYMRAVQAMTGQGGWPLSVMLTPDGRPFWGGTFLPRPSFKRLLSEIARIWREDRQAVYDTGARLLEHLARVSTPQVAEENLDFKSILRRFAEQSARDFDGTHGGFGVAPKFPPAMALEALLRIHKRTGDDAMLAMVLETLDAMARGGIFDQLGGGFHRYSVDAEWFAPHFEKMLYDNALLLTAYLEAYQVSGQEDYARVARETLTYVLRDLRLEGGGFASAEDADSEKTEGKFYLWTADELRALLTSEEAERFISTFNVTVDGNFEPESHAAALEKAAGLGAVHGANILYVERGAPLPDWSDPRLASAREKLLEARAKRVRPLRDDKVLTGWNGLMIAALAKASRVLNDPVALKAAQDAARFVLANLREPSGHLLRRYRDGEARFRATLEDYAFLVHGLLELYQADFDKDWFDTAVELAIIQDSLFLDQESGAYYDTDGEDATLPLRGRDAYDSAVPSGTSVAAWNLLQLGAYTGEPIYEERAIRLIRTLGEELSSYPRAFPFLLRALDWLSDRPLQVALTAAREIAIKLRQAFDPVFLPNVIFAGGNDAPPSMLANRGDGGTIQICEKGACLLPTSDIAEALAEVSRSKPL